MTPTETFETMSAGSLPTFQEEFVGRMFYGTGTTPKGPFMSARRCGPGNRKVEVQYEAPTPFGPVSTTEYANGATLRFARP